MSTLSRRIIAHIKYQSKITRYVIYVPLALNARRKPTQIWAAHCMQHQV